jgi:hypothetical protein
MSRRAVMRPSNWLPLNSVLDRINLINPVTATCTDDRDEWTLLRSKQFVNQSLFERLKFNWQFVTSGETDRFALIFCRSGPNSGVWLHDLAAPAFGEYLPGCHVIESWV